MHKKQSQRFGDFLLADRQQNSTIFLQAHDAQTVVST